MRILLALILFAPFSAHAQWVRADSGIPNTRANGALNRVNSLHYDAPNLFAQSAEGLHLSTDLGATWTDVPLPSSLSALAIQTARVHAADGLLILGGDAIGNHFPSEVIVSSDLGQTWTSGTGLRTGQMAFGSVGTVSGRLYATTEDGIWISTDLGATWTKNLQTARTVPRGFYPVADTMFSTFSNGLYYHVAGAEEWVQEPGPFPIGTGWYHDGLHFALGDVGIRGDFAFTVSRRPWTQQPYGGEAAAAGSGPLIAVQYSEGVVVSMERGVSEGDGLYASFDGGRTRTYIQGDLPYSSIFGFESDIDLPKLHAEGFVFAATRFRGASADLPMLYRRPIAPPVAAEPNASGETSLTVAPNPSPRTVTLNVAQTGPVRVSVLDALGREVARFTDGHARAGRQEYEWPAGLAPGLYVVRAWTPAGHTTTTATVAR